MAINQTNFNANAYLAANPDVATSGLDPWYHYTTYGINEGRQGFDLNSINSAPTTFETAYDENGSPFQLDYSRTPGHVGHMGYIPNDPNDPEAGATLGWIPSKYDFTGAKYDPTSGNYFLPSGEIISNYDVKLDYFGGFTPGAPNNIYQNKFGEYVGDYQGDYNFQGQKITPEGMNNAGYLVDPNTKQFLRDASGNVRWGTPDYGNGGFSDWMANNGWMLPAAMGAGALGAAALGAEGVAAGAGAAEAAGYGSADAYMAASGLNPGAYAAADFAPGYASMGDYMSQAGLDAGTFNGSAFQMPSGLSAKEAATWLSRTNNLAKLLNNVAGMGSSKSGRNNQQLASLLGGNTPQSNSFIGQIKGNQNPFLFTSPNQTEATQGTYDVSGANLANALRKKNGTNS